jgi:methionyl-tRNA formyltransferase
VVVGVVVVVVGGLWGGVQDDAHATYAPKLTRETAHVDWTSDAARIARLIRALDPRPGAWSDLDGQPVKLFGAALASGSGAAGEVLRTEGAFVVAAGTGSGGAAGAVVIEEVQPAGKGRMAAAEWIRGRGVEVGRRLR